MKFNILNNIQREFITLQLEDILNPKKIETVDSKIANFSIISIRRQKIMKFIDEFKIEGFQNIQQYLKELIQSTFKQSIRKFKINSCFM